METERRETYVAFLAFATGNDAGLLVIAPAPAVDTHRWCRWTPSPRLGGGGADDLERLGLATMRVGYALGLADARAGRRLDAIDREWIDRTLPRIMGPAGIVVTAVVSLGPMTEVEIAGDRLRLWERAQACRAEITILRHAAMVQLEDTLNEMGGIAVHDFDYAYDDEGGDVAPGGDLLGSQQPGTAPWRGNVA